MSDLIATWDRLGYPGCPEVHARVRAFSPKFYTSSEAHWRTVVDKPLRSSPSPQLIALAEELLTIEQAYRARRAELAERAEDLIFGKTFLDDPKERFTLAWCEIVIKERHGRHFETWQKYAEQIVGILSGEIDQTEVLRRDQLARLTLDNF